LRHGQEGAGLARRARDRLCVSRLAALGWETVLNRSGTTFRQLAEADKANLDADRAIARMVAQPSMIKRPIVEGEGVLLAGFKPEAWEAALG
jgi:arsenate reductase-like glutaredoxin family protein